jgi:hypothetical protein
MIEACVLYVRPLLAESSGGPLQNQFPALPYQSV